MNIYTSNPFLKAKKQDYLVVIFGMILVFIFVILITLSIGGSQKTNQSQNLTPSPSLNATKTNNSIVNYNAEKQNELYQKLQNPQAVSQADNIVKTKLINSLGNETGILYESDNVAISYLKSVDLFQAEILTPDIQAAKQEANIWLTNQGFSHQGICNLPVVFFLNANVSNQLRNNNLIFSPLPNGC